MPSDPNHSDYASRRDARRGTLLTVGVALALLVAVVVFMGIWGASDGVVDPAAQQAMPADPTVMRDQEAPAITGSTEGEVPVDDPAADAAAPAAGADPAANAAPAQ